MNWGEPEPGVLLGRHARRPVDEEVMRGCKTCGVRKPIDAFQAHRRYRGGRMPVCKRCQQSRRAELLEAARFSVDSKECPFCRELLPASEFGVENRRRDGLTTRCRQCRRNTRVNEKVDPRISRDANLRWRFGIGLAEFEAMDAMQGGMCAACGNPPDGRAHNTKVLHVDHCHRTGAIRQLLCARCNTALGLLNEDPDRIAALGAYIARHTKDSQDQ